MSRSYYSYVVICCALLALLVAMPSQAADGKPDDDLYYGFVLRDLPLTAGKLPAEDNIVSYAWTNNPWHGCRVVLDGPGEAYIFHASLMRDSMLYARTKAGQGLKGRIICVPTRYDSPAIVISFDLSPDQAQRTQRNGYFQAKEMHYVKLWERELPGSAWFRHQVNVAREESRAEGITPAPLNMRRLPRFGIRNESDMMFDMMSGGRAISENLQLRRETFNGTSADNRPVALDTVPGITTKEVDWSKLLRGLDPKIDPLAALIPADQHAVFFPSFTELLRIAEEADANVTPLLYALEPRAEDAGTIERYQKQLCLSRSGLSRVLGPKYIRSVALTGSDLNYRTGTDVAILFEAVDTNALRTLLETKIKLTLLGREDVEAVLGNFNGIAYTGQRTADRSISTYMTAIENAVVVTNSLPQLHRLIETQAHRDQSLAALPEMKYFRDRYKLGDAEEHAFVILSDATIRRWCGPKWRIGSARQVRELATMMELTAQRLDELVQQKPKDKPLDPEVFQTKVDDYQLRPQGIESPTVGSLRFLRPIAELPLTTATRQEVADYSIWRDGYQQNWTRGFDPIAIRLALLPDRLATDVTVLPLIDNTVYRNIYNLDPSIKLQPQDVAHSKTLFHYTMTTDGPLAGWIKFLALIQPDDTGSSVSLYLEDDPELWQQMSKLTPEELQQQYSDFGPKMPWALRIGIKNARKVARENISQAGAFEKNFGYRKDEDMRQIRKHRGVEYVALPKALGGIPEMYLLVTSDALLFALQEKTVHAAIDRDLEQAQNKHMKLSPPLGEQATLHLDPKALEVLDLLSRTPRQREIQNLAWGNIAVLNEWRRLYPGEDPVELHARLWKTRLVCPGGGKYVWNDEWQTMESTALGHPARPKSGPLPSLASLGIHSADFGLTFVDGGLRGKVEIRRQAKK